MDESYRRLQASHEIESRLVSGWSALEQGDIEGARAALRDVYDLCPEHSALPLLAAGIRRSRPKPVRWRRAVALIAITVAALVGVVGSYALWKRPHQVLPAQPIPNTASVPDVSSHATGTAGQAERPATSESRRGNPVAPANDAVAPANDAVAPANDAVAPASDDVAPANDDALIRAAIARFVTAYRSRWTPLALHPCDVTPEVTTATATCRARSTTDVPDAPADDVWTFRLQKSASTWKILSVQRSPSADRP
jgi:hypothetical protein